MKEGEGEGENQEGSMKNGAFRNRTVDSHRTLASFGGKEGGGGGHLCITDFMQEKWGANKEFRAQPAVEGGAIAPQLRKKGD